MPANSKGLFRIGASSVASIVGQGYDSPRKLWRIKTNREEREVNAFMMYGTQNEHRMVTAVECDTDLIFDHTGPTFADQKKLSMLFDYYELVMYPDGVCGEIMLEGKCPQQLRDAVPMKYQIQIQVGFMLDDSLTKCIYAEWTPAETRKWWVYPNERMAAKLWKPIKRFAEDVWEDTEPARFSPKANPKPQLPELRTERFG